MLIPDFRCVVLLGLAVALGGVMSPAGAQSCSGINLQPHGDINGTCSQMLLTSVHDVLNRPYLYIAGKEGGLLVYDVSDINAPVFVNAVNIPLWNYLQVMSVYQDSIYLYLALGSHFTNPQAAGMAIIDVSSPVFPAFLDYYELPGSSSGGGIVKTEGDYAYLGAMQSGLVILDITNKSDIQFVSQFVPDINYPVSNPPNTAVYNARGLEVRNSIVYLCYDAGGIRIINCTDKSNPVETGRYANPALYIPLNLPRAYNNIVLNDTLLYTAVDYCGIEVLNVSDTSAISLTGWWNPYNCPGNNWFSSPSHTNELQYDPDCNLLFVATGKSDAMVIDVSNPALPDSCNYYGGVGNNIGTWGIARYQNELYLSYICTLGIPFPSNYTGIKILSYNGCALGTGAPNRRDQIRIFPNPANESIAVACEGNAHWTFAIIKNVIGGVAATWHPGKENKYEERDISGLPAGMYLVTFGDEHGNTMTLKFCKQ